MRFQRLVLVACSMALVVAPACSGGGDDDEAATDFTPAPTDNDPGPNDTSNAPQTVQGTLRLDPATDCIALETDATRYALQMDDYALSDDNGSPALTATVDGRVLAHDGDVGVFSGFPSPEAATECGAPFEVDSLNSILPAG